MDESSSGLANVVEFPADDLAAWRDWFKVEGKRYRLFKRVRSKDAPWYVYFERKGRRFSRCLETNVKESAVLKGRALVAAVKAEDWAALEGTKLRREAASLGEVFAAYRSMARRNPDLLRARTVAGNIGSLKAILWMVFGREAVLERFAVTCLSRKLVAQFREKVSARDAALPELDRLRGMRTANSYLAQGRSIFARGALEFYREAGLVVAGQGLTEFIAAPGFAGRRCRKTEYHAPSSSLVAGTFAVLDAELRVEDPAAFAAVCLAVGSGLRKSEVAAARWGWFEERSTAAGRTVFLRSDVVDKKGAQMDLPVLAEWWKRLEGVRPPGFKAEDFVLAGSATERCEGVFRRVGDWMTGLGWRTQKKIHEFRAYVASKIAEAHGIEKASAFLRHEELRTTRQFYMRYQAMGNIEVKL